MLRHVLLSGILLFKDLVFKAFSKTFSKNIPSPCYLIFDYVYIFSFRYSTGLWPVRKPANSKKWMAYLVHRIWWEKNQLIIFLNVVLRWIYMISISHDSSLIIPERNSELQKLYMANNNMKFRLEFFFTSDSSTSTMQLNPKNGPVPDFDDWKVLVLGRWSSH